MEIKIAKNEILKGLSLVQSIVERKTTMPILANVLLQASGKNLSITATDLEVGVNGIYLADVVSGGNVTIHARSLYDIVKELPDKMIHLKLGDGNWMEMSCEKSNFRIVGLSSEDFPALPEKGEGDTVKLGCGFLSDMIEKTSFAMSSDETRYNLNGIFLEERKLNKGFGIRMVATDGHRLSIVDREVEKSIGLDKGVIIPRKGILELKKLCDGIDGIVEMWIDEKHLIAHNKNITLFVRLIEGQFPPYEQVVPKSPGKIAALNKEEMIKMLKRVSVLSDDRNRGVKFSFSPKNLDVFTSNPDMGEAHEGMAARYLGESFAVCFNARYVLDALSSIEDEDVALQLGDETSPCVLRSERDGGFTHVIMPMRL